MILKHDERLALRSRWYVESKKRASSCSWL